MEFYSLKMLTFRDEPGGTLRRISYVLQQGPGHRVLQSREAPARHKQTGFLFCAVKIRKVKDRRCQQTPKNLITSFDL